jgi:hypothetical protein
LSPSSAKEATPRTGCRGRRVASVSVEETDVHLSSHLQLLGDRIIHTRDLNTSYLH